MTEASQSEESVNKIELDQNTRDLLDLWKTLNHDQKLVAQLGEITVKVIAAALVTGVKLGQIGFDWQKEKKPSPPRVELNESKKKIKIIIDKHSLDALEKDLDSIMPGGISPIVQDPAKFYEDYLKKLPAGKRIGLPHLPPINQLLLQTYNHYLTI